MSFELKYSLLIFVFLLTVFSITCDNDDPIVIIDPPIFDPLVPSIVSFTANRDDVEIEDNIVFAGEDIKLIVEAVSQAWPESCGLLEDEVVADNLYFTYRSYPPDGVEAPGMFSAKSPGENEATWRVPILDEWDSGEGLVYDIKVTVLDECLDKTNTGSIILRAFANEGPPVISEKTVHSGVNELNPVEEEIDQNGFYEVEQSDECQINIEAVSRTMAQVCANRGVEVGDELKYEWYSSQSGAINLTYDQDPTVAVVADFDISSGIAVSDRFEIECLVTDQCTGETTLASFNFIVVGAPEILSLTGTANGNDLIYDLYFDHYPVLHTDEIILRAMSDVKHPGLCDMKGIDPDLEWSWTETGGGSPELVPEFDPLPVPNDEVSIEFVIPAAENGVIYSFDCSITDRCNGLGDSDYINLLVIVPPVAELEYVQVGVSLVYPSPDTGRYEVEAGDTVKIRILGSAASDVTFCTDRGITNEPPLRYMWENPWDDVVVFNYEMQPVEEYSELVLVVPSIAPPMEVDLVCVVTDICNELVSYVVVPLEVVESGE